MVTKKQIENEISGWTPDLIRSWGANEVRNFKPEYLRFLSEHHRGALLAAIRPDALAAFTIEQLHCLNLSHDLFEPRQLAAIHSRIHLLDHVKALSPQHIVSMQTEQLHRLHPDHMEHLDQAHFEALTPQQINGCTLDQFAEIMRLTVGSPHWFKPETYDAFVNRFNRIRYDLADICTESQYEVLVRLGGLAAGIEAHISNPAIFETLTGQKQGATFGEGGAQSWREDLSVYDSPGAHRWPHPTREIGR